MKLPIIRLMWLLSAAVASAATHAVLPGEAIQPKIDSAAPGDIIAIFGGTYPGDVTINKAVRLVEVDGQDVTITGNVTWNNVTNAPPFEGFTVGSSGKGITVNNTTGLVIKNVDARPGFGISAVGSSVTSVISGYTNGISQDGGQLSIFDVSLTGGIQITPNSLKTVVLRCRVEGDVRMDAKASWFGYSTSQSFKFLGNDSKVFVINCKMNARGRAISAVDLQGDRNSYLLCNNSIEGITHGFRNEWVIGVGYVHHNYPGRGIWISGNYKDAYVLNNYIAMGWTGYYELENYAGEAIGIAGSATALVANNIAQGARHILDAPYGVKSSNNLYYNLVQGAFVGGVVSYFDLAANPLFVANSAPLLQPTSPCVNAGIVDPIFNDLDGTRNDIGPVGGCLFDPEGWTTNKPVVISFDLAPQQLLKGVDTQVTISNGQAVAKP